MGHANGAFNVMMWESEWMNVRHSLIGELVERSTFGLEVRVSYFGDFF